MTAEPNTRPTPAERPVPPADWIKYVPDIVKNAMLTMWNYICDDTKCHPLDIEHGKGKFLTFEPKHWAQFAGDMAAKNIADLIASERPDPQVREALEAFLLAYGSQDSFTEGLDKAATLARAALTSRPFELDDVLRRDEEHG